MACSIASDMTSESHAASRLSDIQPNGRGEDALAVSRKVLESATTLGIASVSVAGKALPLATPSKAAVPTGPINQSPNGAIEAMIRKIEDEMRLPGETDSDRIERWIENAREEISEATAAEIAHISVAVNSMRRAPDSYFHQEIKLRGMGCRWLLAVVEPDRTDIVTTRSEEINRASR